MTDAEKLFYGILLLGVTVMVSLQLPERPGMASPCIGVVMADCGAERPPAAPERPLWAR